MTRMPDPAELSQPVKIALITCREAVLIRHARGIRSTAGKKMSLDMARQLIGYGLARWDYSARHPRLMVTGMGRDVADIIIARRCERRARRLHS